MGVYSIYVYVYILCKTLNEDRQKAIKTNVTTVKDIILYPSVLIVCWSFPLFHTIYDLANDQHSILWLNVVHAMSVSCFGFLNSIVYGFSQPIRQKLTSLFFRNIRDTAFLFPLL